MGERPEFGELEAKIGYRFQKPELLKQAMCHSSYANERHLGRLKSNERLEFLGDAVLELVTSEFLYEKFPKMPEEMRRRPEQVSSANRALPFAPGVSHWADIFCLEEES